MPVARLRSVVPSLVVLLALASAATLPACDAESARQAGPPLRQSEILAGKAEDQAITHAVKQRLATDPEVGALAINVETLDGYVVLRGNAPNTGARSRAADLASTVAGVKTVTNALSVQAN